MKPMHKPERNRLILAAANNLRKEADALEAQSKASIATMRSIAAEMSDMAKAPARVKRAEIETEPKAPPACFTREQLETMAAPLNAEQKAIFWEKWSPELDPAGVL